MGMATKVEENTLQAYVDHIEERVKDIDLTNAFIIYQDHVISPEKWKLSKEEAQNIKKFYNEQCFESISINGKKFRSPGGQPGVDGEKLDMLYIWRNPEIADEKFICIVTQFGDGDDV